MSKIDPEKLSESELQIYDEVLVNKELALTANSKGGKHLTRTLKTDIISIIDTLAGETKSLEDYTRLGGKLNILLAVYRSLIQAKDRKEALEKLLEESQV
jgi:hypothetical protein